MLRLVFHGHYGTDTEAGRGKERARSIALTAMTALIAKIVAMAVPLVTVRITLQYMGDEIYGLWATIVSFFTMFAFADLGLGSGLQTELSKATAFGDPQRLKRLVSSCYLVLIGVSLLLLFIFGVLYPFVNWGSLMNATTENTIAMSGGVVAAIVVSMILNVPFSLIQRTQLAMQEGYRSNLWQCAGNLLGLLLILLISRLNLGVLAMIWASSMITVIVSALNTFVYFIRQRPELRPSMKAFDKPLCGRLLKTGMAFFVLSIFTSVSLSIDNVIVAHTCGLSDVTPYSILYKIAAMIGVVSAMLSSPMWSANGEALQRGEYQWVREATRKIALISVLFSTAATIGILLLMKPALWILTDGTVETDYSLLIGMCLYQIIVSFTNPYFMILNGAGIVRFQIVNYLIYAVISLPMKFLLGERYGAMVIPWIGLGTYLLILTVPTMLRSFQVIGQRGTSGHVEFDH